MARDLPPPSPFAGDDGACDPALASALATYADDPGPGLAVVVAALAEARLLVPVVAHLDERGLRSEERAEEDRDQRDERAEGRPDGGPVGEKIASAAMVTLAAPDGRAVVPVFSSVETVRAWRADARPIPVEARRAALSAVTEADGLLVLDPGGPAPVRVPRPAVWALAQGVAWTPALDDDGVRGALVDVASRVAHVRQVAVGPGETAEVRLTLTLEPGLDRAGLDAVTSGVSAALAASEVVAERVDSLELRLRAG